MKNILLLSIPLMLFVSCKEESPKVNAIDLADLDTTVTAGDDFYRYANGGWQESHPLKAEYARYGAFEMLAENNQAKLRELFSSMLEMETEDGSVEQKIADLYRQGLDSIKLNQDGNAPIVKYIREIYSATDKETLVRIVASMHRSGSGCFFRTSVNADMQDSDSQILYLSQSGLGIGNRDYYFDEANREVRDGYVEMMRKLFSLTGLQNPEASAQNCLKFETALAEISWTNVQNRDVEKSINPMSSNRICTDYDGFDFASYFHSRGIPDQEKINVDQPSFFEGFSRLFRNTDISVLKDYLSGCFVRSACSFLSDNYYSCQFDFNSRLMSGVSEQQPRWKRALGVPNSILSEAVGKMYTDRFFPESSKRKMLEIVDGLRQALGEHIQALDWMSGQTKAYAMEKIEALTVKIGYPDEWKDYSTLDINPALSYFENVRNARIWSIQDNLDRLGKPTDRNLWGMSPQTVNAYCNPGTNEICFPAAILQPPFFNADADDAVNYGAIGVVIGHEMIHNFDDQGRLFDKTGNVSSWWTEEDDKAFRVKAEMLAAQFDTIQVLPGLFANGHFTLGENIADQGGLMVAYSAFMNRMKDCPREEIDGFSPEQRFYLAYAHVWANNITDKEKERRTRMDEHSLAEFRVNASLKNIDSFFKAFGIQDGDRMFRPEEERVVIW